MSLQNIKNKYENFNIRVATLEDLERITMVEAACFPEKEAATKEDFKKRLVVYPEYFLVATVDGVIIGFVNGLVTDEMNLLDEMYEDASFHKNDGKWQMIFGVDTSPDYQKQGIASVVLKRFIEKAREENRKGVVLTCKDYLISFYERFGFVNEGISGSVHGDVVWYQMRLAF